jgi:hypothetical protein
MWLTNHEGLAGNVAADAAAKDAIALPTTNSDVPYTDLKAAINSFTGIKCWNWWDAAGNNKLH